MISSVSFVHWGSPLTAFLGDGVGLGLQRIPWLGSFSRVHMLGCVAAVMSAASC